MVVEVVLLTQIKLGLRVVLEEVVMVLIVDLLVLETLEVLVHLKAITVAREMVEVVLKALAVEVPVELAVARLPLLINPEVTAELVRKII